MYCKTSQSASQSVTCGVACGQVRAGTPFHVTCENSVQVCLVHEGSQWTGILCPYSIATEAAAASVTLYLQYYPNEAPCRTTSPVWRPDIDIPATEDRMHQDMLYRQHGQQTLKLDLRTLRTLPSSNVGGTLFELFPAAQPTLHEVQERRAQNQCFSNCPAC